MANNIPVDKITGDLAKLNTELSKSATYIGEILQEGKKLNTELSKVKKVTDLQKKDNEIKLNNIKLQKAQNSLLTTEQKLINGTIRQKTLEHKKEQEIEKTNQQAIRTKTAKLNLNIKEKKEAERLTAAAEKQRKATEKLNSAYEKLNTKHKIALKSAKDLAAQYGVGSKQAKKAAASANKLGNQLKKIDGSLGQQQRKVGGYFGAIVKGAVSAGVAFIGLRTIFNVFKNSLSTIANFEQAMSKVRAVTGAMPKEFKSLSDNAKLLGSTTSKSATQVSGLQLEFSKLGFSTAEILNATEATISLSIAAGSDLAESAVVAASTVRGFGLNASETQRVVDVMAKSFASSALDLEKFKTSMATVAPIAKANGKDIEFVTARLSVLSDAGLDASTSGTSLRNIFLELSKRGLTWEQGLEKINSSTNKNVTALDLFGKRGATAALILADNIDKAQGLEKAYDGAIGSAKEMADIMEDNLIGDTTKLSSAWEGFILGLNKGEGSISKFFRSFIQWATGALNVISKLNETILTMQDRIASEALTRIKRHARAQNRLDQELYNERINALSKFVKDGLITYEQASARELVLAEELEAKKEKNYKQGIEKRLKSSKKIVDDVEYLAKYEKDLTKLLELQGSKRQKHIIKLQEEGSEFAELALKYDESVGLVRLLGEELDILNTKEVKLEINNEDDTGLVKREANDLEAIRTEFENRKKANAALLKLVQSQFDERFGEKYKQLKAEEGQLTDSLLRRNKSEMAAIKKTVDAEKEAAAQRKLIRDQFVNSSQELGNILFDLGQSQRDRELTGVQSNYAAQIAAAEGNTELQEKLAKDLAREEARIQREQARSERNQALFNIAISTAENIAKAGFVIPLTILAAGIGIAQTAAVLAQPLPEVPGFFKGTESAPAGLKWVAEKGSELLNMPDGRSFLAEKPTLIDTKGGEQILNHSDTTKALNAAIYEDIAINGNEGIESRLDGIASKLGRLKQVNVNFDADGMDIRMQKGNSTIKYLNKKGSK